MKPKSPTAYPHRLALLLVLLIAFGLRLYSLTRFSYHMDEYFTLAAAKLIAETGWPRYPTGLFYDPGLPFSYLGGVLFHWFGFSEALGRWPAVIFGTLAVASLYRLGASVLKSRSAGLAAALWLALNVDSVAWGGRARMITLAQWLALLSILLLWQGLSRPVMRQRLLFALSYGLTLLTHFSTVVLLPAWLIAGAVIARLHQRPYPPLLRDGALALIIAGLALSSGVIFQPPPSLEFQTSNAGLETKVGALATKFLQIPSDLGHAWEVYGSFFLELPQGALLLPLGIGLAAGLISWLKQRRQPVDLGVLYLALLFVGVMGVLVLVINPHWQRARYLLMQSLGLFYLLGAHGLRVAVAALTGGRSSLWQGGLMALGAALIALPFLQPLQAELEVGYLGWNRYDLAAQHIGQQMSEGDKVMSMHPPANLIYLNQSDYYLVQSAPKLIIWPDGTPGDRYTGAQFFDEADALLDLFAGPERVWFLVQEFWLFNSYDSYLQQNLLQRMDKAWGEGGVWAMVSRGGTWPLARRIDIPLQGEFENGVRLAGFHAHPATFTPGSVIWLTLFWQGETLPNDRKVFVHLRDAANTTVAQADHLIYDGKVPTSRWKSLFRNDPAGLIRDGATLSFPPDLPPGSYRLLIGFYHPETFERVGVINDQSGESAVVILAFEIQ